MEMHKCKICFRKFISGRALGGHMSRSHFTKLPLPQKKFQEKKNDGNNEKLVELSEEKGVAYVLREKPRKSFKVMDHEFFDAGSVVVQDIKKESETETETEIKSTIRGSNKGKTMMDDELSYITSSDEDVALFLLMLSRGELKLYGKYKCEVCSKVFKSSQALGGHKVSHKNLGIKKRVKTNGKMKHRNSNTRNVDGNKVHECPHCGRLFGSGQALGGHKRSHFVGNPSRVTTTITTGSCSSNVGESLVGFSNSEKFQDGLIDLNFPAPMDDDYGDGFSQQEASAVSVAD
ncbi:hypothetical protein LIER_14047 [Lithospermum erythrorhizon]|uniref:C2H2-type domain-containing protein n=1 Tax=Lithospermum erythrorhizon TaxID=34254 RepID=A0AAV3PYM1_LITER